jgi:hypothetical protein
MIKLKENIINKGGRFVISDGEREREKPEPQNLGPRRKVRVILAQANFEKILNRQSKAISTNIDYGIKHEIIDQGLTVIQDTLEIERS